MAQDPNAADALDSTGPDPADASASGDMQDQGGDEQSSNSFFIPKDVLDGSGYKDGDKTITLNVLGPDQDGDLEVCCPTGDGESKGDWRSELKSKLAAASGGNGGM